VNRSAAEQVADLVGVCLEDVLEQRDERFVKPSVFALDDDYYAAGENCPKHQVGEPWQKQTTWRGDVVWVAPMEGAK